MGTEHNEFNDVEYTEALTKLGNEYHAAKDYAEKYEHVDSGCKQCMQYMQLYTTRLNIIAVILLLAIIGNITLIVHFIDVMGYINKL